MKLIILLLLLVAAQSYAGWFDGNERQIREYEQRLHQERQSTGDWQIVAGVIAIGAIILFTAGTALGSKTRRDGKQ